MGLTLHFADPAPGTYVEDDEYDITAHAPFVLSAPTVEHLDLTAFGLRADDANASVANTEAFHLALGALRAGGNSASSVVARGTFFFDDTLHINQCVVLRGTGRSEPGSPNTGRSTPGTHFVFPRDVDGIHLHSGYAAVGGADFTELRNLTLTVVDMPPNDGQLGNGIRMNAVATVDHVTVEGFGENGILVSAGAAPPADNGIAGTFQVNACAIGGCRGDGFQAVGSDANVGLVSNCNSSENRGWGFRDRTTVNTYLACHASGNTGLELDDDDIDPPLDRNYAAWGIPEDGVTDGNSNNCLFIGCYIEMGNDDNQLGEGANVIGGTLATPGSVHAPSVLNPVGASLGWAMQLQGALVSNEPLLYEKIITDPDPGRNVRTFVEFGQRTDYATPGSPSDAPGIFNFAVSTPPLTDSNTLRYLEDRAWWALHKTSAIAMYLPSLAARHRRVAPLFENGLFFGSPLPLADRFGPPDPSGSKAIVNHRAVTAKPVAPLVGIETWEKGDIAWNANPAPGGPLGWRCIAAGTFAADPDPALTANVAVDGVTVDLSSLGDLNLWSYVTIGGEGPVQIVSWPTDLGTTVTIDSAVTPGMALDVVVVPPRIVPFGNERCRSTALDDVTEDDFHVDCTTTPMTITLPAEPWDGEALEIKDATGTAAGAGNEITVSAGLLTIDGAPSIDIVAAYGSLRVRYSATQGEWLTVA